MRKRILAVFLVMSLFIIGGVLLLQPSTTEAKDKKPKQQLSVSEMITPGGDPTVVGASRLLRSEQELSMTISTTGLTGGNAHTIWWAIFNNPKKCATKNLCGSADLPSPFGDADAKHVAKVGTSVVNATGLIVGADGVGNFSASLKQGVPPAGLHVLFGPGLKNAQGAEVHLVVRDHGEPILNTVGAQTSRANGGCGPDGGPNDCMNVQASIHLAP